MTVASHMRAKIVRIKIEEGKTGLFYATSPELRGLLVAESTLEALDREIPKAIAGLYAAGGEEVLVSRAQDSEDDLHPWVAIPAAIARQALASGNKAA